MQVLESQRKRPRHITILEGLINKSDKPPEHMPKGFSTGLRAAGAEWLASRRRLGLVCDGESISFFFFFFFFFFFDDGIIVRVCYRQGPVSRRDSTKVDRPL